MKFVDVKNDVAFRKIFGNEQKKVILISFLNAVLGLEGLDTIRTVTLVNPFQLPRIRGERSSIIDVRAKDGRNRSFIIEMQVAERDGFAKRIQYYACKDYASQIDIGEEYPKLKPVYFIGILNFKFFPGKHYFSKHLIVDEDTGICTLEDLKFRFIELPKFKKKINELETIIDQWTFFIKHAHKLTLIPEDTDNKGLLEAYSEANRFNWSKAEYDAYIYAGMRAQDEKGRVDLAVERGVEKAVEKKVLQIIENCWKNGMRVEDIAVITELEAEKVRRILEGLK
ncbi:MAG: Rpn family recombination-promoting nuclease/putative transposase [Chitinophagales bacterium]